MGQVMPIHLCFASSREKSREYPFIQVSLNRPYLLTASVATERALSRSAICSDVQAKSIKMYDTCNNQMKMAEFDGWQN